MLLYAVTNGLLRYLGELGASAFWLLAVKESIAVACLLPWILFRLLQGRYRFQSKRLFFGLILGGIICEIIGAPLHLWAYAAVGLVVAVPMIQSTQMIAAAVFGRVFLKDAISSTKIFSIFMLILAVLILSCAQLIPSSKDSGAEKNSAAAPPENANLSKNMESEPASSHPSMLFLGGLAAITAGIAYSVHTTVMRYSLKKYWDSKYETWGSIRVFRWIGYDFSMFYQAAETLESEKAAEESGIMNSLKKVRKTNPARPLKKKVYSPFPITLIMFIILGIGAAYFSGTLYYQKGLDGFLDVPPECWFWVLVAGIVNLLGFFFQIQGLLLASAAKVSLISTAQIVILTITGILFFSEPINFMIVLGSLCAIIGVFFASKEAE